MLLVPEIEFAGPPYDTDDPEPVDFEHWELFFSFPARQITAKNGGAAVMSYK